MTTTEIGISAAPYNHSNGGFPGLLYNANGNNQYYAGFNSFHPVLRLIVGWDEGTDSQFLSDLEVQVYPNVTSDQIWLDLKFDEKVETVLMISNMKGEVVKVKNLGDIQEEILAQDISGFVPGQYLVMVQNKFGRRGVPVTIVR